MLVLVRDHLDYSRWELPLMVPMFRLLPRIHALLKKPALGAWFRNHVLYSLLV